ncbi:MAG: NAD(P)-dependent oxidoreductase [Bacteroidaceae bacterium]|nr:NAD(P)-dependent oxidoreductase [Bacteroidaceae bacterium]
MAKSILITGASGFIGSFLVEESLRLGMQVYAAVRQSSSRQYLNDERIHCIETDFSSAEQLTQALQGRHFDYVVHAAGVTKCQDHADFYRVNTEGTQYLCQALTATQSALRHFVFLSSLSVMGAIREAVPHQEITIDDTPLPNTHYGKSKLQAEERVRECMNDIPYTILRPTGVYGPREKDYLLMAQSINRHVDFSVGYRQQDITFIYVSDVVQAVFCALQGNTSGQTYLLTDGHTYTSQDFSKLLQQAMGVRRVLRLRAPLWLLRAVCAVSQTMARWRGKATTLNNDKYHILRQRNWMADIEPARQQLGYNPQYNLQRGVEATVEWYRKEGWL